MASISLCILYRELWNKSVSNISHDSANVFPFDEVFCEQKNHPHSIPYRPLGCVLIEENSEKYKVI